MLLARYVPLTDEGGYIPYSKLNDYELNAKLVIHRGTLNRTVILMFGRWFESAVADGCFFVTEGKQFRLWPKESGGDDQQMPQIHPHLPQTGQTAP